MRQMSHKAWGNKEEKMRLWHLLYEVLSETTSVQLIMLSYPQPNSMLYPQGIDHNKNIILELTQKNSIENFIQNCLPCLSYILKLMIHTTLLLAYSKQPCVCLKVNICLTCCMTSSFQNLLHSYNVTSH